MELYRNHHSILETVLPEEIETRSFEIISQELGERHFHPLEEPIIKRCIHTTADFDYADNLCFSESAVKNILKLLPQGVNIVTDTQMAKAGINKKKLETFGGKVFCFMSDTDVARAAAKQGTTRAVMSMKKAAWLNSKKNTQNTESLGIKIDLFEKVPDFNTEKPLLFAVGNAPTALIEIVRLAQEKWFSPSLVIGVPVGFVNVVQAKEMLISTDLPYIAARGRKGGSNVAAAIINALLYMLR